MPPRGREQARIPAAVRAESAAAPRQRPYPGNRATRVRPDCGLPSRARRRTDRPRLRGIRQREHRRREEGHDRRGPLSADVQGPSGPNRRTVPIPASGTGPARARPRRFRKRTPHGQGSGSPGPAGVLNFGGTDAEGGCLRADVEKQTKVKELSDAQVDGLYTALNNLAVAVDQERRPVVVFQDGRAIDATPIELAQYHGLERRDFPAFNQALSHYLTVAEPETAAVGDAAARFERRIVQQRESMEALREEAMRLEAQAVRSEEHTSELQS